ncbi:cytochrome P450 [Cyathus striatus]|nr:cytochrome P450 [Cyathus striatus]
MFIWDIAVVCVMLGIIVYLYTSRRNGKSIPLPPGPRKLPLVGNIFDIPSIAPWKTYAKWSKLYKSDVLHLQAAGSSLIILNSYEAAKELLEKRSAIYSSRPHSVMLTELSGCGFQFSLMPYTDEWRARRTLFQRHLHPTNTEIYQPRTRAYVQSMLKKDSMTMSIALGMTYGIQIRPLDDPYVANAQRANKAVTKSLGAGSRFVDVVPVLKYVPEWMPGAGFQRDARVCKGDVGELKKIYDDCVRLIGLFTKDTTASTIEMFILAMLCYPEIQQRAQHELDSLLDGSRSPEFGDRNDLPYFNAVVKETLRWEPIVPTGVVHLSTEEDMYNGMLIPKNSIVVPNAWAMLHNEEDYPEPWKFNLERWIDKERGIPDSESILFGFGRSCLSDSAFSIKKARDAAGKEIEPPMKFDSDALVHPKPFICAFEVRCRLDL